MVNGLDSVLSGEFCTSRLDYPDQYWQRGFRVADLLVLVDGGSTEEVSREIFRRQRTVVATTLRLDAVANVCAHAYFVDSNMLNRIIEDIKSIDHVDRLEHSEIIRVVDRREDEEIRTEMRLLQGGERMTREGHLPGEEDQLDEETR